MTSPVPSPRSGADPIPNRFDGYALKAFRCKSGLSRTTVASRAQLSRAALKSMERNQIRPSEGAFRRLCEALGVSVEIGTASFTCPGPADHRPMEFAAMAAAADRSEALAGRRRGARLLMVRRGARYEK